KRSSRRFRSPRQRGWHLDRVFFRSLFVEVGFFMLASDLWWLPENADWNVQIRALGSAPAPEWADITALANCRMDFLRTERLDKLVRSKFGEGPHPQTVLPVVRLAILGSCLVSHLIPAIRVAFMRRGIWAQVYSNPFGQYLQD